MGTTSIEWTDHTVQPGIFGCTITSEACRFCYAAVMARRQEFMAAARGEVSPYAGTTRVVDGVVQFNGAVRTDVSRIGPAFAALPKRVPGKAFVTSMGDVFHKDVPTDFIAEVFGEMAVVYAVGTLSPDAFRPPYQPRRTPPIVGHVFQVLTKRIGRARRLLEDPGFCRKVAQAACRRAHNRYPASQLYDEIHDMDAREPGPWWPLPNVWIGATIEDKPSARRRVEDLAYTPAAVRFASCEPLLDDVSGEIYPLLGDGPRLAHEEHFSMCAGPGDAISYKHGGSGIGWVIAGVESRGGRPGRPTDEDWVRSLRDSCAETGAAFFYKQGVRDGRIVGLPELDGVTHAAFPEAPHG